MKKSEWIWMPHAAHLIVGDFCRFRLATCVGNHIVSTVGEYVPDAPVREILAKCRDITLEGQGDDRLADYLEKIGFEEIGAGRLYETMVFRAKKRQSKENQCCPYEVADLGEVDFCGYNTAVEAAMGHMELCEKWAETDTGKEGKKR